MGRRLKWSGRQQNEPATSYFLFERLRQEAAALLPRVQWVLKLLPVRGKYPEACAAGRKPAALIIEGYSVAVISISSSEIWSVGNNLINRSLLICDTSHVSGDLKTTQTSPILSSSLPASSSRSVLLLCHEATTNELSIQNASASVIGWWDAAAADWLFESDLL